jgi:antitoxin Phd
MPELLLQRDEVRRFRVRVARGGSTRSGRGDAAGLHKSNCSPLCRRYDYYGYTRPAMRKIQLKDAKAKLSAVVDQATRGKPSVITRHGKPEAVVLGFADWERLSRVPSFGRLLMSAPLEPADLSDRDQAPMRDAEL